MNELLEKRRKEVAEQDRMEESVRNRFFKLYPKLFKDTDRLNFSLPVGWIDLVETLCEELKKFDVNVKQVKQKFGGLRFYVGISTKLSEERQADLWAIIQEAESKSLKICEICGTDKEVSKTEAGFIQSLCPKCKKIENEKW